MFRNDTGFGGNNGMTGFSEIFGLNFREQDCNRPMWDFFGSARTFIIRL